MKKLTKTQLRIAVAKDVIKAVNARKMKIKKGQFLEAEMPTAPLTPEASQKIAVEIQKQKNCQVCALGACFVSLVALDNDFDFTVYSEYGISEPCFKPNNIYTRLRKVFNPAQLYLIEQAFETEGGFSAEAVGRYEGRDIIGLSEGQITKLRASVVAASMFGKKFRSDRARLKAIMENIIANKGTFVPPENKPKK